MAKLFPDGGYADEKPETALTHIDGLIAEIIKSSSVRTVSKVRRFAQALDRRAL